MEFSTEGKGLVGRDSRPEEFIRTDLHFEDWLRPFFGAAAGNWFHERANYHQELAGASKPEPRSHDLEIAPAVLHFRNG